MLFETTRDVNIKIDTFAMIAYNEEGRQGKSARMRGLFAAKRKRLVNNIYEAENY